MLPVPFLLVVALFWAGNYASAQQVKISGFSDISLGSWAGSGDLFGENNLCVYNSNTPDYRIRARGGGAGHAFTLSGTGGSVAYQVKFKELVGTYVTLDADSFHNFSNANILDPSCGALSNATLEVRATESQLSGAAAGSYSGTLTILLETR